MTVPALIEALQASRLTHGIAKANHLLIASLQILHVFGITLLLASLFLISLRLWGRVLTERPATEVVRAARRLLWPGMLLAIASGIFMFMGSPRHYYNNPAFDWKMGLLALAILMQLGLQGAVLRERMPRLALQVAAGLALLLWLAVGVGGRAIGFV